MNLVISQALAIPIWILILLGISHSGWCESKLNASQLALNQGKWQFVEQLLTVIDNDTELLIRGEAAGH